MLSANDIHYLVGLLTLVTSSKDVDVKLGSMIYDAVAEVERDVDVTVTYRNNDGSLGVLIGMEVKHHKRPLDVVHVEQLCAKFQDMPNVTHRAIVSTSGYSNAAIRKAKKYHVELLHLVDWDYTQPYFGHVHLINAPKFIETQFQWVVGPQVHFNPLAEVSDVLKDLLRENPTVQSVDPNTGIQPLLLQELANNIGSNSLQKYAEKTRLQEQIKPGDQLNVSFPVKIQPPYQLQANDEIVILSEATISGRLTYYVIQLEPHFKMLIREEDGSPYVACSVAELNNGNMIGITVSSVDRSIMMINLSIDDRLKNKISRHRLQ